MDFYSALSRYYNYIFPLNPLQVKFIAGQVPLRAKILEVGSATGNLSRALAEKGYRVVGIDLEKKMVKKAREENSWRGVEFLQMDMLEVDEAFEGEKFSGVVCLGNTLVHLPSREKIAEFIGKTAAIMDPSGLLFVQIVNYNRILKKGLKELPEIDNEKIRFQRFYDIDPGDTSVMFRTRLLAKEEKKEFEQEVRLQALLKEELDEYLEKGGFNAREYYGDFQLNPYSEESPATIVKAGFKR